MMLKLTLFLSLLYPLCTRASFDYHATQRIGEKISNLLRSPTWTSSSTPAERRGIRALLEQAQKDQLVIPNILNYRDQKGRDLLTKAMDHGYHEAAKILVEFGALPTIDQVKVLAKNLSEIWGDSRLKNAPLVKGIYAGVRDYPGDLFSFPLAENGATLPMLLIAAGLEGEALELVKHPDFDPGIENYNGWTVFDCAARYGAPKVALELMKRPTFNPTHKTKKGFTPLTIIMAGSSTAELFPHLQISADQIGTLLENLPIKDRKVESQEKNHPFLQEIARLVLKEPALINTQYGAQKETIVMYLLASRMDAEATKLITQIPSFDPNVKSTENSNAGIFATRFSCPRAAMALLAREDLDVDTQDADGNTMAIYAAVMGNHQVFEVLVRVHANLTLKNRKGLTAMDHAIRAAQFTCIGMAACTTDGVEMSELNPTTVGLLNDSPEGVRTKRVVEYVLKLDRKERAKFARMQVEFAKVATVHDVAVTLEQLATKLGGQHLLMLLYAFEDKVMDILKQSQESKEVFRSLLKRLRLAPIGKLARFGDNPFADFDQVVGPKETDNPFEDDAFANAFATPPVDTTKELADFFAQ